MNSKKSNKELDAEIKEDEYDFEKNFEEIIEEGIIEEKVNVDSNEKNVNKKNWFRIYW